MAEKNVRQQKLIQIETMSQPDLLRARIDGLDKLRFHLEMRLFTQRFIGHTDPASRERLHAVQQLIPDLHTELHNLTRPSFRALLMEIDEVKEVVDAFNWMRSKLARKGVVELSGA